MIVGGQTQGGHIYFVAFGLYMEQHIQLDIPAGNSQRLSVKPCIVNLDILIGARKRTTKHV
jgi:hypothetical protein